MKTCLAPFTMKQDTSDFMYTKMLNVEFFVQVMTLYRYQHHI